MTQKELAAKWKVDRRTINRWVKHNAPLHDDVAMSTWIEQHRSRMFVGKYTPRCTEPLPALPQPAPQEVVAEVVPIDSIKSLAIAQNASSDEPDASTDELDAPTDDSADSDDTPDGARSTLGRLEEAERVAYRRYIDTGGSERAAQVWLLVCDQKRKLIADQAQQASDISEAETKFMSECWEVRLGALRASQSVASTARDDLRGLRPRRDTV